MRVFGVKITVTRMIAFGASLAAVVAATLYLEKTRTGLHMRALANRRSHAALIGIPVTRVETAAWAISGGLAGFTGLMFGDLVRLDPTVITFMVIPPLPPRFAEDWIRSGSPSREDWSSGSRRRC